MDYQTQVLSGFMFRIPEGEQLQWQQTVHNKTSDFVAEFGENWTIITVQKTSQFNSGWQPKHVEAVKFQFKGHTGRWEVVEAKCTGWYSRNEMKSEEIATILEDINRQFGSMRQL